jgi:hypothetical protein
MTLCPRNIVHMAAAWGCWGASIFVDDIIYSLVSCNRRIYSYIPQTNIFLYSSALRSSVVSSDNRGIYIIFLGYTTIFVSCNRRIFNGFL